MILSPFDPTFSFFLVSTIGLATLIYAIATYSWSSLAEQRPAQHALAISVLVLTGLWSLRAGVSFGLHFHILGVTAITLMMGWRLAFITTAVVLLIMAILGVMPWYNFAVSFAFAGLIPIAAVMLVHNLVARHMRHNPFVYIFASAFFNAGLAQGLYIAVLAGWYWWDDIYDTHQVWYNYLRYLPLMMFPEGIITGMFISGMVVYNPRWLSTFDEDSYFRG